MGTPLVMGYYCPRGLQGLVRRRGSLSAITVNRKEKKIISKARAHPWFYLCQEESDILRESCELVNQSVEDYLAQRQL